MDFLEESGQVKLAVIVVLIQVRLIITSKLVIVSQWLKLLAYGAKEISYVHLSMAKLLFGK